MTIFELDRLLGERKLKLHLKPQPSAQVFEESTVIWSHTDTTLTEVIKKLEEFLTKPGCSDRTEARTGSN